MILSTDDGGASWKLQRGGAKRMAMVGVFTDENEIPWDLLTQTSAQQAYRVHIVLLASQQPDSLQCEISKRLETAASQIGASAEVLTRLPYPQAIDAAAPDLLAKWQQLDGQVVERLLGHLTRVLRVNRPDVVVTSGAPVQESATGAQQLLSRLILHATERAADPQFHTPQIESLGLQPWKASRVVAVRTTLSKPVSLETVSTATGDSVAELSRQSRRLIGDELLASKSWSLFTFQDGAEPLDVGRHPLSDSGAQYGSAQRRARTIQSIELSGKSGSLRQLLQAKNVLSAKNIVGSGQKRLEHAERLLGNQRLTLGNLLFDLSQQEFAAGNLAEADLIRRHMVSQHSDHPLVDHVLHQLISHHTSMERAWLQKQNGLPNANDPLPAGVIPNEMRNSVQPGFAELTKPGTIPQRPEPIRLASAELPLPSLDTPESGAEQAGDESADVDPNNVDPNNVDVDAEVAPESVQQAVAAGVPFQPDHAACFQLARQIKTRHPDLYGEPQILFPLAAASRIDGQSNAATGFYRRMESLPYNSPWKNHANDELVRIVPGTEESAEEKTVSTNTWICKRVTERPVLDGQLGDACWRQAKIQELHNPNGLPATQIVIARDDEFFYIAAACLKRSAAKYLPKRRPRPRDADLSKLDRLRFSIDINRDYSSWWGIEIDHRGWTNESLQGDFSWNPKYYVASETSEETWTIEAAIPLDQLAPSEYQSGDWAIGVQRIVPELFVEGWKSSPHDGSSPELQGVIRLE